MGKEKKERISERGRGDISGLALRAWNRFLVRVDKAGVREANKRRYLQELRQQEDSKDGDIHARLYLRQRGDY